MADLNIAVAIVGKDQASGPIGQVIGTLGRLTDAAFAPTRAVGNLGGILQTAIGTAAGDILLGGAQRIGGAMIGLASAASDIDAATDQMTAGLQLSEQGAANFESVMKSIYANNFGAGFDDIGQSLMTVEGAFGRIGGTQGVGELQQVTEAALALRDVFGTEVAASADAASTLIANFGLTGQEAMDFITAGMQRGLNSTGDFLETIGEYSTQFANGGASADQFFSLLESGMQGGMLGTDKAADAFKEFRVRIQDGSTLTAQSLAMLGINSQQLAAQMADGSVTAADAFQMVVERLGEVDDANVRMQAGVGLIGTQFEDLGTEGALALSLMGTQMSDLEGATNSLNAKYTNLGSLWEGLKRTATVAFVPLGEKLLEIGNRLAPAAQQGIAWFGERLPGYVSVAEQALGGIVDTVGTLASYFQFAFEDGDELNDMLSHLPDWLQPIALAAGKVTAAFSESGMLGTLGTLAEYFQFTFEDGDELNDMLTHLPAGLQPIAEAAGRVLAAFSEEGLQGAIGALGQFMVDLMPALATLQAGIAEQVRGWGAAFVEWVGPMIPSLFARLGQLGADLVPALVEAGQTLAGEAMKWGAAFVEWIGPMIPPFLTALGEWANQFVAWVGAQVEPLRAQLGLWWGAFVEWIVPAATDFLARWPDMLRQFLDWIGSAAGPLLAQLGVWAVQFVAWIIPMLPEILAGLAGIAAGIIVFIGETAGVLIERLILWGSAFVDWVQETAIPKISPALEKLKERIGGWIGGALSWLGEQAGRLGTALVDGIAQMIRESGNAIRDALTGILSDAVAGAKAALGIHSPSRVAAQEIGLPFMQGIAAGLTGNLGVVEQAMAGVGLALQAPAPRFAGLNLPGNTLTTSASGGGLAMSGAGGKVVHLTIPITVERMDGQMDVEALAYRVAAHIQERL